MNGRWKTLAEKPYPSTATLIGMIGLKGDVRAVSCRKKGSYSRLAMSYFG